MRRIFMAPSAAASARRTRQLVGGRVLAEALLPQALEDVVRLQLGQLVQAEGGVDAGAAVTSLRVGSIFARRTGLPSSAASTWARRLGSGAVQQHPHFQIRAVRAAARPAGRGRPVRRSPA
jgi:hypothetical protein